MYIEFEVRQGDADRARKIVFRAMATCPWCKGQPIVEGAEASADGHATDAYLFAFSRALAGIPTRQSDTDFILRVMEEKMLRTTRDVRPLLKLVEAPEDELSEDEVEKADRLDRANANTVSL